MEKIKGGIHSTNKKMREQLYRKYANSEYEDLRRQCSESIRLLYKQDYFRVMSGA